jgi:hypothetical protein
MRIRKVGPGLAVSCLAALVLCGAMGCQTVRLAYHYEPGATCYLETTTSAKIDAKTVDSDGDVDEEEDEDVNCQYVLGLTEKVLAFDPGASESLVMQFTVDRIASFEHGKRIMDSDLSGEGFEPGPGAATLRELIGKTCVVAWDASHRVMRVEGFSDLHRLVDEREEDREVRRQLHAALAPSAETDAIPRLFEADALPHDRPVAVGAWFTRSANPDEVVDSLLVDKNFEWFGQFEGHFAGSGRISASVCWLDEPENPTIACILRKGAASIHYPRQGAPQDPNELRRMDADYEMTDRERFDLRKGQPSRTDATYRINVRVSTNDEEYQSKVFVTQTTRQMSLEDRAAQKARIRRDTLDARKGSATSTVAP